MKVARGSCASLAVSIALAFSAGGALAQLDVSAECKEFESAVNKDTTLDDRERDRIKSSSSLSHTLIWENDSFAAGGDFNYTNGMKLTWLHNPCRHKYGWLKTPYKRAMDAIFSGNNFQIHTGGLFGMNMYTPNDLSASGRITTDRPYAGWLYFGVNLQATSTIDPAAADHQLELQVGITGPKTGQREAQEYIHRNVTDSQISQGWDNQIGQRLGVNALYAIRKDFSAGDWVRAVPHAGFSLGNLMQFVNGGGMMLIGKSANDYPGTTLQPLRDDVRTIMMMDAAPARVKDAKPATVKPKSVLYGFVGLDARYIFNSVFVEGFGEAAHDIEMVHGVYDLIGGLTWGNDAWRLSYKIIYRSKEFTSPDPSLEKSHRFGQFSIGWFF